MNLPKKKLSNPTVRNIMWDIFRAHAVFLFNLVAIQQSSVHLLLRAWPMKLPKKKLSNPTVLNTTWGVLRVHAVFFV